MPWHESIIEAELAKTKVLVNATAVGLHDDETPIPAELIPPDLLVMDLIYNPPRSRLLRDAAAAGCQVLSGEVMLLHQGAAAFTLWTGQAAPVRAHAREARRGPRRRRRGRGRGRRRGRRHGRGAGGLTVAMTGFRFLTAGESHGPALGATLEGLPAGIPVTADAIAVDLRRRQGGYGRGARQVIEQDRAEILAGVRHGRTIGSPVLLLVRNRDWESWTRVMQVEPLSDEEAAELAALADGGNRRAQAVTRVRPGHADLAGRPEVRLRRRPPDPRARLGPRDGRARRRGRGLPGVPRRARDRGLVVHGRGRRRRGRPRCLHPLARGGRGVAPALPRPGGGGADDRPDRRGARVWQHGRRRLRGRGPRPPDRPRQPRPLGPPPRRRACRRRS